MKESPSSKPAAVYPMPNRIADEIRDLIVRGALSPGEHLRQTQLAERFNVSRVPIREALKLLAAEGIVTHDANRGSSVTKVSAEEARQLYKLRRWIEGELLSTAEWPSDEQAQAIEAEFDASDAGLLARDRGLWRTHLREARRAILDLSPQKILLREALSLWSLTDRYRSMLPLPDYVVGDEQHHERALLSALRRRDRAKLLDAYNRERDRVENMLLAIFDAQG